MFEVSEEYFFGDIKESLGVKDGSSILKNNKENKFVALCVEEGFNFLEPNIMLVKNGTLIKKIGRDLSGVKYPIKFFLRNSGDTKYTYLGDVTVEETKTAPRAVKSRLQNFSKINPKDISRLVYLTMPELV
ncbi:hypothetical protein [Methylovulum psychrotolerans]|uniref:Uncharacterized protein n=1 Tax=Methylovulum psychrotolerans TaxID=1704499 RepID=A0A2S5CG75_9GAMM|nr:hypothetical protein [Methylovulum psychrotolerans]POZ49804.1 hypothetical protein AADEFJLK_04419 [Methylovulum psychrotolerans]